MSDAEIWKRIRDEKAKRHAAQNQQAQSWAAIKEVQPAAWMEKLNLAKGNTTR